MTHTLGLARRLVEKNCFVVFISSNLVFDGARPKRRPDEPVCPQTEYGRQKAEVEAGLATWPNQTAIVRLTKVVHADMALLKGWIQVLKERKRISAFGDSVCSPIGLDATVGAIATLADRQLSGIWHLSGASDMTYFELARCLAKALHLDQDLVDSLPVRDALNPEHLPRYSTLDATRSERELGFQVLDPAVVIERIFAHEPKRP